MQTPEENPPEVSSETQRQALAYIAYSLVEACPDLRQMARQVSLTVLQKYDCGDLEPDNVYWHRFSNTQSSARTFTGWQHSGPPVESLTLPQLVMHRFNPHDQEATDELQSMGGFYTADEHAQFFDEHNEVRLLPQAVLNDFWAIDFRTLYLDKLTAFWRAHPEDFRTLVKANFIAKALQDRDAGWLSPQDCQTLMQAIGVDVARPVSLAMLQTRTATSADIQICTFDVVGYQATDILRIVLGSGRQILFTPGELQCFYTFETPEALHWWLMSQTNQADNRTRFMSHFTQASHAEAGSNIGLHDALDLLFSTWGAHGSSVINRTSRAIDTDVFEHLSDAAKARMFADANTSLRSNGDLRKLMWIAYLSAFNRVFGPMAAMDWPIALAVVGAGLAETGLNIDQAINGHTTAERKAGIIGAVISGIDTLLNSTLLILPSDPLPSAQVEGSTSSNAAAMLPDSEPALDVQAPLPYPANTLESSDPLAPFESNVVLDAAQPAQTDGRMNGVYLQRDGSTYISISGMAYAVRYVNELQTWVIIDPQNPFSFYRNVPVRRTASTEWEVIPRAGLNGGGPVWSRPEWARSAQVRALDTPLPSPYDVPVNVRDELREAAENDDCKYFDGYRFLPGQGRDPFDAFEAVRDQLRQDAAAFFEDVDIPPHPPLPEPGPQTTARQFLKQTYKNATGLVVGEAHHSIGSKQLLIDNMPLLARLKVKTLYMEHLLTDFHQADLDAFARSGRMTARLKTYIRNLDGGHGTDPSGRYTFLQLITCANANRIRIQAIDCMASYRIRDLENPSGTLRQELMNFFASRVISVNQIRTGEKPWVALMGNTHAGDFEGVKGVADLQGAIGLRVQDVRRGTQTGFDIDPGLRAAREPNKPQVQVRSDIRLRAATLPARQLPIEQRLKHSGDFHIRQAEGVREVIHRSADGSVLRTPIWVENGHFFIIRPSWPRVSHRRFDSVNQLSLALIVSGMREIA